MMRIRIAIRHSNDAPPRSHPRLTHTQRAAATGTHQVQCERTPCIRVMGAKRPKHSQSRCTHITVLLAQPAWGPRLTHKGAQPAGSTHRDSRSADDNNTSRFGRPSPSFESGICIYEFMSVLQSSIRAAPFRQWEKGAALFRQSNQKLIRGLNICNVHQNSVQGCSPGPASFPQPYLRSSRILKADPTPNQKGSFSISPGSFSYNKGQDTHTHSSTNPSPSAVGVCRSVD